MIARFVRPDARIGLASVSRDLRARRTSPQALAAAACAALGLALAGCGSGSSAGTFKPSGDLANSAGPSGRAIAATPRPMPTEQVDRLVLQAYTDYQKTYKTAYERNDPAELPTVATDPVLTQVTKDIAKLRARGVIWRFVNVHNPRVYARSDDGRYVYVVDCVRTLAAYRFSARTGKRTAAGTGSAHRYRTTVAYEAGTWKVSHTKRDNPC